MTPRKGDFMQVWTGGIYWPLDPRAEEVYIEDIAHSLAMQCRYGGHCSPYYSVAEHSVHVSRLVPPHMALLGLLHDATEAYLSDVIRPLKRHLTNYKEIEQLNWLAIAERFGLPAAGIEWPEIHKADAAMLHAEGLALLKPLMGISRDVWLMGCTEPPAQVQLDCWGWRQARREFMDRYEALTR